MKKIVHIIPSLQRAGAERFVVDLANRQSKLGNKLFIISLYNDVAENSLKSDIDNEIKCFELNKTPNVSLGLNFSLYKVLKQISPDIVNTHLAGFEYSLYSILKFHNKIKFFHIVHNLAEVETPNKYLKIVKRLYFKKKMVQPITISNLCLKSFNKYYNLNADCVIYNGSPKLNITSEVEEIKRKLNTSKYDYVFLNVARISFEKNQKMLVEAFMKFNKSKNCLLIVIGTTKNTELYNELIAGKDNRIVFEGLKNNVADYLSIADAFCLSSIYEGMPISLIEALSMSCIPITTSVGGMTEMIENQNVGFLSCDLTTDEYVKELNNFYESENKMVLKQNCKTLYERKYDIDITAKNYLKQYEH